MGKSIKKRDSDLGWVSSHIDLENPGRIKAKQSSNMVFIGSALIIGFTAIIYAQLMSQNMSLVRKIREHEVYMADEYNMDMFNWNNSLQQRKTALINYKDGAEKFLEQLKNADRVSEASFRDYETALKDSTSTQSRITSFIMDNNQVYIEGSVPEESMPRTYAEYLTNQKDAEGNPKFALVQYTGFNQGKAGYDFSVAITLWDKIK